MVPCWHSVINLLYGPAGPGKEQAAAGAASKKASRKERLRSKKAAKRAERTAGSDDEDLAAAEPRLEVHCCTADEHKSILYQGMQTHFQDGSCFTGPAVATGQISWGVSLAVLLRSLWILHGYCLCPALGMRQSGS